MGDLADKLGISSSSISQHLALLFSEQIASKRQDWNRIFYRSRLDELDPSLSGFLLEARELKARAPR